MSIALSEQEQIRRQSLQELRNLGINPYPAEAFNVTAFAKDIKDNFNPNAPEVYQNVTLAGRIMSRRIMGSAIASQDKQPEFTPAHGNKLMVVIIRPEEGQPLTFDIDGAILQYKRLVLQHRLVTETEIIFWVKFAF